MVLDGILMPASLPQTASHEGTGTIVACGDAVRALRPGDRVMCGIPKGFCGECAECRGPNPQYCPKLDGHIGVTTHGAFAEYVVADGRACAKLPDEVSFGTAAPMVSGLGGFGV
jgi:alcohol dehydrogenase, propanol-preferring